MALRPNSFHAKKLLLLKLLPHLTICQEVFTYLHFGSMLTDVKVRNLWHTQWNQEILQNDQSQNHGCFCDFSGAYYSYVHLMKALDKSITTFDDDISTTTFYNDISTEFWQWQSISRFDNDISITTIDIDISTIIMYIALIIHFISHQNGLNCHTQNDNSKTTKAETKINDIMTCCISL